jgi:hypothetical protein
MKKNDTLQKRMKAYEGWKPWSLLYDLNCFIHELFGPQINNFKKKLRSQTISQEMLKFLIIDTKIFLVSPAGLKQALVTMVKKT